MECTIVEHYGRSELIYGRQELTGEKVVRFFDVSEGMIDEIRNCPTDKVQEVIARIKHVCPELF